MQSTVIPCVQRHKRPAGTARTSSGDRVHLRVGRLLGPFHGVIAWSPQSRVVVVVVVVVDIDAQAACDSGGTSDTWRMTM